MQMSINASRTIKRISAVYRAAGYPEHTIWVFEPLDGETAFPELVAQGLFVLAGDGEKHRLTDAGRAWILKNRPDRDMSVAKGNW